jgi:hypothetical protein
MDFSTFNGWIEYFSNKPTLETLTDTHLSKIELMLLRVHFQDKKTQIEDLMLTLSKDEKLQIRNERIISELKKL